MRVATLGILNNMYQHANRSLLLAVGLSLSMGTAFGQRDSVQERDLAYQDVEPFQIFDKTTMIFTPRAPMISSLGPKGSRTNERASPTPGLRWRSFKAGSTS